jgi:hypothetical protein
MRHATVSQDMENGRAARCNGMNVLPCVGYHKRFVVKGLQLLTRVQPATQGVRIQNSESRRECVETFDHVVILHSDS